MVKILCEKCNKAFNIDISHNGFDIISKDIIKQFIGYEFPILCKKCSKKLNKITNRFLKDK